MTRARPFVKHLVIAGFGLAAPGGGAVAAHEVAATAVVITANSALLALSATMGVGVLIASNPARKAARRDPIEALRHQ